MSPAPVIDCQRGTPIRTTRFAASTGVAERDRRAMIGPIALPMPDALRLRPAGQYDPRRWLAILARCVYQARAG